MFGPNEVIEAAYGNSKIDVGRAVHSLRLYVACQDRPEAGQDARQFPVNLISDRVEAPLPSTTNNGRLRCIAARLGILRTEAAIDRFRQQVTIAEPFNGLVSGGTVVHDPDSGYLSAVSLSHENPGLSTVLRTRPYRQLHELVWRSSLRSGL